ncbi:MAG: hypothetical protein RIQ60_3161 [Pseudomonadota bacterium]
MAGDDIPANGPQAVLAFWFDEITPKQWWAKSDDFDRLIEHRFGATHAAAERCELAHWRDSAQGRLAEVIVLDQFSRNIYRNQPRSFASDPLALALAQTAVATGADQQLDVTRRVFLYMPYMHSESARIHSAAVQLFSAADMPPDNLAFELRHRAIIERFGRYPHRNAILARSSTAEEIEYLAMPGSSF